MAEERRKTVPDWPHSCTTHTHTHTQLERGIIKRIKTKGPDVQKLWVREKAGKRAGDGQSSGSLATFLSL